MKKELFALVDCNNFYVSCERVFNPKLKNKPVIVLSNNDGCVIARSNEVKAFGIPMGMPIFECEHLIKKHNIIVYSSNFTLYGDMSSRVFNTLKQFAPEVEIYSIDEAFIRLTYLGVKNAAVFAMQLRATVLQWTGIPVSIGIGPTKTLAKIANKKAKKDPAGIFDLTQYANIDELLDTIPVEDIWGIGRHYTKLLNRYGFKTAKAFKYADDHFVKKRMTVTGLRTLWELRGTTCIPLEEQPAAKKGIMCAKSFGKRITDCVLIKEAAADYVAIVAAKVRKQCSLARAVYVFVTTSYFTKDLYYNSDFVMLPEPTAYTPDLIKVVHASIDKIFKSGYAYKKVGVMLTDLVARDQEQQNMFIVPPYDPRKKIIMHSIDTINKKWGKRTLTFAAQGIKRTWGMKQTKKSSAFTTHWDEIPVIKI